MSIAIKDLNSHRHPEKEPDLLIAAVSRQTFKLLWMNESWKRVYTAGHKENFGFRELFMQRVIPDDNQYVKSKIEKVLSHSTNTELLLYRYNSNQEEYSWVLCFFFDGNINYDATDRFYCLQVNISDYTNYEQIKTLSRDIAVSRYSERIKLLTKREKEVLVWIAKGRTYTEIASELFIHPDTVNKHRENIQKKLNLKGIAMLVCFAIESGIVNPDESI